MPLTPMFENHLQSFDYVIESKWDLTKEPLKLQAKVKDDTGYNVYSKVIKPSGEEIKNDIVYISENIEHDAKIEVIFTVSAAPLSNREYKVTLFRDKYPLENPRVPLMVNMTMENVNITRDFRTGMHDHNYYASVPSYMAQGNLTLDVNRNLDGLNAYIVDYRNPDDLRTRRRIEHGVPVELNFEHGDNVFMFEVSDDDPDHSKPGNEKVNCKLRKFYTLTVNRTGAAAAPAAPNALIKSITPNIATLFQTNYLMTLR